MVRTILAALACLLLSACSQVAERGADAPRWIVSLDYCADQYVLKFADREDILALSPDAEKRFPASGDSARISSRSANFRTYWSAQ